MAPAGVQVASGPRQPELPAEPPGAAGPASREGGVARVATALRPEEVVEKLAFASRRGRLAGFRAGGDGLFSVAAFGQPFDRVLVAEGRAGEGGTVLEFRSRLLLKWPMIFAAVMVFTVWPGVWLTDSLLRTYFPSYPWWGVQTWMWYLPLAALPLPWVAWSMWRKSEAAAAESAREAIGKIAAEVGGRVEQGACAWGADLSASRAPGRGVSQATPR